MKKALLTAFAEEDLSRPERRDVREELYMLHGMVVSYLGSMMIAVKATWGQFHAHSASTCDKYYPLAFRSAEDPVKLGIAGE